MNRRTRRALVPLTALAVAALTTGTPGQPAVLGATDAAWVDAQYAGGSVTAGSLEAPVLTDCTTVNEGANGALSALGLTWTSPLDDAGFMLATLGSGPDTFTVPTASIQRSGPAAGLYTYSFTVTPAELEPVFGPLADTSLIGSISTRAGTSWVSPPSASRTISIGSVAGGPGSGTCDLAHVLSFSGITAATAPIDRVIPVGTAATSSLLAGQQDRRRTPEYTVILTELGTGAPVPGTPVTITLPDGLAFESGPSANLSTGTFTTSDTGTVTFRVVGNRSEPAAGPIQAESARAFTVLSAAPVTSVPLVAWGYSVEGQTGSDNRTVARTSAVPLWDNLDISGATALGSSYSALFYADQNGSMWARGYNASGTLGDGTTTTRPDVVAALTAPGQQLGGITYIGTGTDQLSSVAVDASGGVWATGDAEGSGFGAGYVNTRYWQRVSDRYTMPAPALTAEVNPFGSVLMVLSNGQAMVAGQDPYGYSAQGAPVSAANGAAGRIMLTGPGTPITGVTSGGIGWESSAVVTSDGRLYTAGTAAYGGSGTFYLTRKTLPPGKTAAKVFVRQYRMLVLMTDGTVYALGANTSGASGVGNSSSPGATLTSVALPLGNVVTDIAMGNDGTLFLLADGSVQFAGLNDTGGLGVGSAGGFFYAPARVRLAHTATKIGASWYDSFIALLG